MTDHQPDPAFTEHLEWQLRTELRRQERFGVETPRPRRWWPVAALALISMCLGASGTVAADRLQRSGRQAILVEQARLELDLAQAQLEMARESFGEVEARAQAGIVTTLEVDASRSQVVTAEGALRLRQLDLEESERSGQAPQNELSAPAVGDRDFVRDRLRVELDSASARLEVSRRILRHRQEMFAVAIISSTDVTLAEVGEIRARARQAELRERLKLRQQFRDGQLTALEVERAGMRQRARLGLEFVLPELELARSQLQQVEQLHRNGAVSRDQVRSSRSRVRELETRMKLARLELRLADSEDAPTEKPGKDENSEKGK